MERIIEITLLLAMLLIAIDNRRQIRRQKRAHWRGQRRVLLDTSVAIDGRIVELAKTGFLNDELVIPRSVLAELQLMADGSNTEKRARARFGLDVVAQLQKLDQITVTIFPDDRQTPEGVDNRLLEIARDSDFVLATLDYNLNKVAVVEGVTVLNFNDLARAVRPQVLPGEKVSLKLTQEGQGKNQAVGRLSDGTMAVVAGGKKFLNQTVTVEIAHYVQSHAGKIAFAELADELKKSAKTRSDSKAAKLEAKQSSVIKTVELPKTKATRHRTKRCSNLVKAPAAAAKTTKPRSRRARQDEYLGKIIEQTSTK